MIGDNGGFCLQWRCTTVWRRATVSITRAYQGANQTSSQRRLRSWHNIAVIFNDRPSQFLKTNPRGCNWGAWPKHPQPRRSNAAGLGKVEPGKHPVLVGVCRPTQRRVFP